MHAGHVDTMCLQLRTRPYVHPFAWSIYDIYDIYVTAAYTAVRSSFCFPALFRALPAPAATDFLTICFKKLIFFFYKEPRYLVPRYAYIFGWLVGWVYYEALISSTT